jgi:hypothetical protein
LWNSIANFRRRPEPRAVLEREAAAEMAAIEAMAGVRGGRLAQLIAEITPVKAVGLPILNSDGGRIV